MSATWTCNVCHEVVESGDLHYHTAPRREDAAGEVQQAVAMLLQQVLVWREQSAAASRVAADSGSPAPGKWDPVGKAAHLANLANALDFMLAQFRDATAALSTAERDVKRWRFVRERLVVWTEKYMSGDSAPTLAGRIGFTRLPPDTPIAMKPDEVDKAIDHVLARVPSGGEEGRT